MDASTFKATFLPCSQRMYRAAWRLTGNAQEAEDLVQEAMLRLWTKRNSLPPIDNAGAYCATLIARLYMDQQRAIRLKTADAPPDTLPLAAPDNPERQLETSDAAAKVMQRIQQLPPDQQQVITLRDIDGLSYPEIAAQTGLTEGNIRVILSRARKAVRRLFSAPENKPTFPSIQQTWTK